MAYKIWLVLFASVTCGILYRIGGKGGFNHAKAIRRFGCPIIAYGLYALLTTGHDLVFWAMLAITYGFSCLAMASYHDYLTPSEEETWINWLVTGLAYGAAAIPLIFTGMTWYALLTRTILLGIGTMVWSESTAIDTREEFGRGFLFCATIPILLWQ